MKTPPSTASTAPDTPSGGAMCCRIEQLKAEIGGGYDMVVANIVADVIIGLSGQVRPFLKKDGLFLCSGIIDDRAEEVARHLREAGWDILRTRQSEGWFSYLCR